MKNRSGEFIQNLTGELAYKSFKPTALPPNPPIEMNDEILKALIDANKKIAHLNGLSSKIRSLDLFVAMYIRKEALLSSQIEGTQCTLDDILDPLAEENQNRDIHDVLNYIKATEFAIGRLGTLPLCNRLIRQTHEVLLGHARGQDKNPGQFRTSQNWIGGQGCTLENAHYIPPNVQDMTQAMSDLEKYMNLDESLDPLIQIALIHYQFETIHPFLDGNGRVGRLLITLFLMEKKILTTPALYVSYYLKINRIEYYDRMSQVRRTGDFEQWVLFFLNALIATADDAIETINKLANLHEENYRKITTSHKGRSAQNIIKVFEYLEKTPIINTKRTAEALHIAYNTVASAVRSMQTLGILALNPKKGRGKTFSYREYLQILRKDTNLN